MSKYYKAEDVINAIENKIAEYIPTLYGRYEEIPLELRMAIESLPTIEVSEGNQVLYGSDHNCILTMFGECSYNETGCGDCAVAEKIRKALEVSEDCISREGVYRAIITCGEVDNDLNHLYKVIENEPSVVPQVPNEDAISKATVLEIYSDLYWIDERLLNFKDELDKVYEKLQTAPSVVPTRAEGKAIDRYDDEGWTCSICGKGLYAPDDNYCPNCGAKMKGEGNERI